MSGPGTGGRTRSEHRVCAVDDLPPGEVAVLADGDPVAVFNVDGKLLAIADTCSHETASLAEGWVDGETVECPYHLARFCLRTGRALCLPATQPVATYQVIVRDGFVYVLR
ncbi:bifunctional 3-phenylpropionate/cinnamic acid dioxygenase ferredoxin subunit [Microtetraspora fusca]|uniref:Bifunctional 3-phenylpropionate/cinnamic acid dioxygenase ferredoxin subunit n=1 Tax=Microtetraspora fusca TaxID=1997 RepID=A0ABW6VB49_MICFU|nr:bifunctional 3-phenylpropionate/cinnamic acid dioxygenase ferredoxin subunit [Microtetraspora fusca]